MRRRLTASALLALALAASATSQPPKLDPPKAEKKADPAEAAIAAALANDPDVKMARAKIQLAEAELAKARHAVTLKVLATQSAVQDAKLAISVAEQEARVFMQIAKSNQVPNPEKQPDYRLALDKVERAKAKLATAEAELKLLVGNESERTALVIRGSGQLPTLYFRSAVAHDALEFHTFETSPSKAPAGPIPERIRAALDKPVKLGAKDETVKIGQALEVFKKEAGLDVPVRGEFMHPRPLYDDKGQAMTRDGQPIISHSQIISEGETLPVGAWLQLFQDTSGGTFYVREYGLLFAKSGPPDAPTLTAFWKQKPPAKPEPKP